MSQGILRAVWSESLFRAKRLYTTLYYGQYTSKFALVLVLPISLSYIRYRAETKYGYSISIDTAEEKEARLGTGGPDSRGEPFLDVPKAIAPQNKDSIDPTVVRQYYRGLRLKQYQSFLQYLPLRVTEWLLTVGTKFENGQKIYMPGAADVRSLQAAVFGGSDRIPPGILAGCRGRVFAATDDAALMVRAFCKRDPRIVFWRDTVLPVSD